MVLTHRGHEWRDTLHQPSRVTGPGPCGWCDAHGAPGRRRRFMRPPSRCENCTASAPARAVVAAQLPPLSCITNGLMSPKPITLSALMSPFAIGQSGYAAIHPGRTRLASALAMVQALGCDFEVVALTGGGRRA